MTAAEVVVGREPMTLDAVLDRLRGIGAEPRRSGPGWLARCPLHDDDTPSMSVKAGDAVPVVAWCYACGDVADRGAWFARLLARLDDPTPLPPASPSARRGGGGGGSASGTPVASYDYVTADGTVVARHVRLAREDGGKGFLWYRPYAGGWAVGLARTPVDGLPLYRLPELLAAGPSATVYVVEGEKDADNAAAAGMVATTSGGGAAGRLPTDVEALRGRDVVVVADNDGPGLKHARAWADRLVGIAARVRLALPAVDTPGADLSDHLAAGLGPDGLRFGPVAVEVAPAAGLDELLAHAATWLDEPDTGPTLFALAVAVAAHDVMGEPLWGMLVGAPSSGKTERVRMLDDAADDRVDELTAAALLSWSKHKDPRPVGILTRVPDRGLLTVGDFSTVLATSDRGGRDQLFALLRRVYDGAVARDLGNAPAPLRWSGRLSVLAAVTPAIDDYATHADALGPRWLFCRMREADTGARLRRARRRAGDLTAQRGRARALASSVVAAARTRLPDVELDDDTLDRLGTVAVVAATARGSVPRDGYGRREVIGVPVVEEPHRLVAQLHGLTRALLALGVTADGSVALAARCAMDTVPRARAAVLDALADGELLSVQRLALTAGLHRHVAARAAEDLRELRLTGCAAEDDPDLPDDADMRGVRRDWHLAGDLAGSVIAVMLGLRPKGGTKRGDHPPDPPGIEPQSTPHDESDGVAPHASCHPSAPAAGPSPCRHGRPDGDRPDPFVGGRLSCPECAMEAAS